TASMWVLLCEELEARRATASAGECSVAAKRFEEAAKEVFKSRPARLRDALEIAGDIHQASGVPGEALRSFSEAMALSGEEAPPAVRARIATKLAMGHEAAGNATEAVRN